MNPHRKGNAFPDLRVPGDPRLQDAIARRTPNVAGGGLTHVFGGIIITPEPKARRGGGSSTYIPWAPNFFTEGTAEAPIYKVRFNLGTLNNVAASNWDDKHTLANDDSVRFVVIEITTASGKITGFEIAIQSDVLSEDVMAKDTPPTSYKILLGTISKSSGQMIETTNLNAAAAEVFRESKTVVTPGGEPFSRWWRWAYTRA